MNETKSSPLTRILVVSLISGFVSGAIVMIIMFYVYATPWAFFIIPAIMGPCIHKFAGITAEDIEADEKLDKRVGWTCAGMVLLFVLAISILYILIILTYSEWYYLFLNIGFWLVCGVSVYYGYDRGVQAVIDAGYDSELSRSRD